MQRRQVVNKPVVNNRSKSQAPKPVVGLKPKPKEAKVGNEYCTKEERLAAIGKIDATV